MGLAIIAALALVGVALFLWLIFATIDEAERRRGRGLTVIEILVLGAGLPYSLAFVWFAMPEVKQEQR